MVECRLTLLLLSLLLLLRLLLPLKGLTLYRCSSDGERFFCGDFSFRDLSLFEAFFERAALFVFACDIFRRISSRVTIKMVEEINVNRKPCPWNDILS